MDKYLILRRTNIAALGSDQLTRALGMLSRGNIIIAMLYLLHWMTDLAGVELAILDSVVITSINVILVAHPTWSE